MKRLLPILLLVFSVSSSFGSDNQIWCVTMDGVTQETRDFCIHRGAWYPLDKKDDAYRAYRRLNPTAVTKASRGASFDEDDLWKLKTTNECAKCDLSGANLTDADLKGAKLVDANLSGVNLVEANLFSADLTDANLSGANLTKAILNRAILNGAKLTDANLAKANLAKANLTKANLTKANLAKANLTKANLTKAILNRAILNGANLTDANLTRANLTGAKFCNTQMPSGTINNSGCDSITKKDAPKPAPTPASSRKTWCGMHDSTEYLKVSDCFSRNGIPTANRSQAGRLKNDYFAKKNHKAFAKASDTATWISQSFNTLEAKEGALTHCHGVSKQPSTCRIVNVNGQYVDEAPAPVPDSLNVSSDHRLTDLVGRYSMIHKDLKAYDGYITLKVSGGAVIAEMELCYEFSTCAKFKQTKPPEKVGRLVEFAFKKVSGPGFMWDEVQAHITFSADVTTYTGRIGGYRIVGKRQGQGTPTQAVPKDKDSDDPEESSNQ